MKSDKRGIGTLVEITNVSPHGIWLYADDREYFLPFEKYPWFRDATIAQIHAVEVPRPGHFHWPELDVDLHRDILENPEQYPLVAKS